MVAAALKGPRWTPEGTLSPEDAAVTKDKIKMILAAAKVHGFRTLVLGAWGCGAYYNPPAHIAALFRDVLGTHGASFDTVVFAVIGDGNPAVFARAFA